MDNVAPSRLSNSLILNNADFEFKLLRQFGLITYGGATFGECYKAARNMVDWNLADWVREWASLAEEVESSAISSQERGHDISACEAWLRASNYYHAAEYYALIASGDHVTYGLKCKECFEQAMPLLPYHCETVNLKALDSTYPCYFFKPDSSDAPRRTVILVPGIESCGEEQYFYHAVSALQRGYAVFIFQGPGQTGMFRLDPSCYLRHDFEVPLLVGVDYLEKRKDVDMSTIAVIGSGLGSYFVSRLAVFDPRIKALVVNPPFVDMHKIFIGLLGPRATYVDFSLDDLNELPDTILRVPLKLFILNMCRRFGVSRLQQFIKATEQYSIGDRLYRIHCPTLCIHGDTAYPELEMQSRSYYEGISSEVKSLLTVQSIHEADAHDHVSNLATLNQIIFDWLDELDL
jgi:pimeloyl-ACP methyl ester carboxylesterase